MIDQKIHLLRFFRLSIRLVIQPFRDSYLYLKGPRSSLLSSQLRIYPIESLFESWNCIVVFDFIWIYPFIGVMLPVQMYFIFICTKIKWMNNPGNIIWPRNISSFQRLA